MTRFKNSDLMVSVLPETYAEADCQECSKCTDCTDKPDSGKKEEFVTDKALGVLAAQLDRVLIEV